VVINPKKCIGCKNCVMACPFGAIAILGASQVDQVVEIFGCAGVPKENGAVKFVHKCDLCIGRDKPACVATCPNEALRLVDPATEVQDKRIRATEAMGLVTDSLKQGRL
jgi:electron transport protein HydN